MSIQAMVSIVTFLSQFALNDHSITKIEPLDWILDVNLCKSRAKSMAERQPGDKKIVTDATDHSITADVHKHKTYIKLKFFILAVGR